MAFFNKRNTLFEIFIFCPKIQLWFPEKIVDFFGVKNSWKCCGFGLFSCWQLWFHEKNCQKNFGWETRENVGVLSKLNFGQKFDFSNSVYCVLRCELSMSHEDLCHRIRRIHTTIFKKLKMTQNVSFWW